MTIVECAKTRFESRDEARAALVAIQRNPRVALKGLAKTGKMPSRVYECPECRGWHLTAVRQATAFREVAVPQEGIRRISTSRCACHAGSLYDGLMRCPGCNHWSFDFRVGACERHQCSYEEKASV